MTRLDRLVTAAYALAEVYHACLKTAWQMTRDTWREAMNPAICGHLRHGAGPYCKDPTGLCAQAAFGQRRTIPKDAAPEMPVLRGCMWSCSGQDSYGQHFTYGCQIASDHNGEHVFGFVRATGEPFFDVPSGYNGPLPTEYGRVCQHEGCDQWNCGQPIAKPAPGEPHICQPSGPWRPEHNTWLCECGGKPAADWYLKASVKAAPSMTTCAHCRSPWTPNHLCSEGGTG